MVHGCFWHRHQGCRYAASPSSRQEFWEEKFAANIERDRRNETDLRSLGWQVHVVWECELRDIKARDALLDDLADRIRGSASSIKAPSPTR